ncbi:hypothetical protein Scep_021854 [Stephania cephalantha]|uniref:Aminotransferase-like plant mobile domain-containing protein n=1 Tax=Stephania cephalantha TaxID=152367 RepID=A0AAP0F475_9MAGN
MQLSRLTPLIDCLYWKGNKELISAFVEQWQPETNTFHLPFSEMSITLEDINILLKISVMGKVVAVGNFSRYTKDFRKESIQLISKLLGITLKEAEDEANITKGLTIRKAWLKTRWSLIGKSKPLHYPPVQCTARAFMLYLLSCTLFADKSLHASQLHCSSCWRI